jgi:hypothetical protein
MSPSSTVSGLSYLSAALQDRRALLLGYVKNDVVTQDRLALLWTIEAACGGSPSRAPETHPVLAAPALAPACRPDCRAVFKELAVVGSPLRSGGRCPWIASPGRLWCAVARWAVCEDSPFCPTTTPTHGNKLMLPIRAGTTKRQRWWPSVTSNGEGEGIKNVDNYPIRIVNFKSD